MSTTDTGKRETLNIRIRASEKSLIDRAAQTAGKNRTDFILDAARQAAEETLLEQSLIQVSAEAYTRFLEVLDRGATPNARLRKTMRTPSPW